MIINSIDIILDNKLFSLLSCKGLWFIEKKILFLSDIHLGKAEFLQLNGIPIPTDNP